MNKHEEFKQEVSKNIAKLGQDENLKNTSTAWIRDTSYLNYSYNFSWMGRPIIQYPQDIVAMQEIVWATRPDLIIETGIAHGGSLIYSASLLAMLDYCDAVEKKSVVDPQKSKRLVLGVDIDIRAHNREAIEAHPMSSMIKMIQGSSIDQSTIDQVYAISKNFKKVLVILDSNHTHEHVLKELEAYAPLTTKDSYCVVFDTVVEDMPEDMFSNRPWGKGDNPKTAVHEYLKSHTDFEIDKTVDNKLLISVAPDGYLKRIK